MGRDMNIGQLLLFCGCLSCALAGIGTGFCQESYTCQANCDVESYPCGSGWLWGQKTCYRYDANCQHTCYRQVCCAGYEDTAACDIDIDECVAETDDCSQVCTNSEGSFTCSCNEGYELEEDGTTCTDIDECEAESVDCSQVCVNSEGSYTCACDEGYGSVDDGKTCTDIDECDAETDDCSQVCTNSEGSYTCSCNDGYELDDDGTTCTDIDECDAETDDCSQVCTNSEGSYTCSCSDGYELDDDGTTCSDIDECEAESDDCSQVCVNSEGSYTCACDEGYESVDDGKTCTDIDECVAESDDCSQVCVNSEGSYTCACDEGYESVDDGKTCTDIDFCESSPCSNGGTCEDHLLTYTCDCPHGYEGEQCEEDLCEDQADNLVPSNDGKCRTYIKCSQSGQATAMCCRGGRKFDADNGECMQAYDTDCIQEVCEGDLGEECRLAESVLGETFFIDLDDHAKHDLPCPVCMEFSLEDCGCVRSSGGGGPVVTCPDFLEFHPTLCVCVWPWMI